MAPTVTYGRAFCQRIPEIFRSRGNSTYTLLTSWRRRSSLVGDMNSTVFEPNDIPGQKRRLKWLPSLRSASTDTSMPGDHAGTEAYHSLPSEVGCPLLVKIRS